MEVSCALGACHNYDSDAPGIESVSLNIQSIHYKLTCHTVDLRDALRDALYMRLDFFLKIPLNHDIRQHRFFLRCYRSQLFTIRWSTPYFLWRGGIILVPMPKRLKSAVFFYHFNPLPACFHRYSWPISLPKLLFQFVTCYSMEQISKWTHSNKLKKKKNRIKKLLWINERTVTK